jgi:hypothetical protein
MKTKGKVGAINDFLDVEYAKERARTKSPELPEQVINAIAKLQNGDVPPSEMNTARGAIPPSPSGRKL